MSYIGSNGGKNFFISDQSFSGANAFADAVARGGFVATISDASQNAFIANALQANGISEAHIGYSDAASEGNFVWQDGSTSTYENWQPGEPSNTDGGEDYVTISAGGNWNDVGARGTGNARYIFQLEQTDGFLLQTNGLASGSSFPIGVTTNTFEAYDASGNSTSCSFDVTLINDNELPFILVIDDQTSCGGEELMVQTQITDNVSISDNLIVSASSSNANLVEDANISITNTANEFTFNIVPEFGSEGTTTITINASDEFGNVATSTFDIVISSSLELSVEETDYIFEVSESIAPIQIQNNLIGEESFASYSSSNSGALNGINFTVSSLNQASVSNLNLNNPNWNSKGFRPGIEYNATSPELTITFEAPVKNLNFYLYFLRGFAGGYETYTFSEPFVVTHGLNGLPTTSTTIDASNTGFASGIVQFENPVSTLTITGSGQADIFGIGGFQGFTVSQSPEEINYTVSPALPEGLNLAETTGVISGTPLSSTPATNYTITGTTESGCSGSVVVNLATNEIPTISNVDDLSTEANTSFALEVELQDVETDADDLILTASSGDVDLINTFDISSTGSTRTINITPETNALGSTLITLFVEDEAGAISQSTFNVNVIDTPIVITQNIEVALDVLGEVSITPEAVDDGSSSISGIESLELDIAMFSCDNLGNNTVTLSVSSNSGETATGTAIVTVVDNIAPTIVLQDVTVELDAEGMVSVEASAFDNGSFDNCGEVTFSTNLVEILSCGSLGLNEVTVTVTDASGNQSQNTAILTVEDNLSPAVVTQDLTVELDANGEATITAAQVDNGSADNCGVDTLALDITSFDCSNLGENTVTLTVTDASGNEASATAIVTVEDNVAPIVITQDITVDLAGLESASITSGQVNNGSTDNCTADSDLIFSLSQDTFTETGTYTVSLTAEDALGNSSSANLTVTVTDSTLSTDEFSSSVSVDFYPNPAQQLLNIEANRIEIGKVIVFTITGSKALEGYGSKLNVSTLSSGVYLAKIESREGKPLKVIKFIKK
jgi:hypothetical protein